MDSPERSRPGRWHAIGRAAGLAAVAGSVAILALGLAAYSAAASYESVSRLAARLDVPLAWLNPLGIDGGLLAVIVFDIALTWTGRPIWWLRLATRAFAAGMVTANAAAGWPVPAGVGLRIAAPVLFIVIVEAARHVLLHRADERAIDRIPRIRWLLDFRGTFALWRRMRLWGERSYIQAIGIELDRIAAIEKLAMKYGAGEWESAAPADLVWMLRGGVRMAEALARVAKLTAPEPGSNRPARPDRATIPAGHPTEPPRGTTPTAPGHPAGPPQGDDATVPAAGGDGEALPRELKAGGRPDPLAVEVARKIYVAGLREGTIHNRRTLAAAVNARYGCTVIGETSASRVIDEHRSKRTA